MGVDYYEKVQEQMGAATANFFWLFMVPGMFHCRGGVGPSTFDAFTPLVQWVEKGTAPEDIIGSRVADDKVARTRPVGLVGAVICLLLFIYQMFHPLPAILD